MVRDERLEPTSWEELAARASQELDAAKLMDLVQQLCEAVDRAQSKASRRAPHP